MHPSQDNVEIQPENEFCLSNHMTIFVGAIYAYKGLLMVFAKVSSSFFNFLISFFFFHLKTKQKNYRLSVASLPGRHAMSTFRH